MTLINQCIKKVVETLQFVLALLRSDYSVEDFIEY